jgi:hypothetical protein
MPADYPDAGKYAPAGVRRSIAEWERLPASQRMVTPLLYWLLGSGTDPYKMSQHAAGYVEESTGAQRCDNCTFAFIHAISDGWICSQMRGWIEPEGWCILWARQ